MKWYLEKLASFQRSERGVYGTKNNYRFDIHAYTKGFNYQQLGWYVSVKSKKDDKSYNSLWDGIWFKEQDEAKAWCESYADFMKDKVIQSSKELSFVGKKVQINDGTTGIVTIHCLDEIGRGVIRLNPINRNTPRTDYFATEVLGVIE